ncbi:hypothetical protein EBZ38_02940 [bacterium]|nr:hypothetical protein [bacterium]
MITFKLLDSISEIEKKVNESIATLVNRELSTKKTDILQQCKNLINGWILSQPEILSLNSSSPDSLAGQFGLLPGQAISVTNSVINAIQDSITVKIINFNNKLQGGITVEFQPSNFLNILNIPQGHTLINGGDLHWMDWLLKRGDNIIIVNYQYDPKSGVGRSGLGHMINGGAFRVPPQFSGTEKDNFITRALIGATQEAEIAAVLKSAIGA